jgi:hypothetical protein
MLTQSVIIVVIKLPTPCRAPGQPPVGLCNFPHFEGNTHWGLFSLFLIRLQVEAVERSMHNRGEDETRGRDQRQAAVQRVETGK